MNIPITEIQRIVAQYFRVPKDIFLGESRKRHYARPRQIGMALAREFSGASMPRVGMMFGGRDHTTCLHAQRRVEELEKTCTDFASDMAALRQQLRSWIPRPEPVAPPPEPKEQTVRVYAYGARRVAPEPSERESNVARVGQ